MKKKIISNYFQLLFGIFGLISSCSDEGAISTAPPKQLLITKIPDPNFEKKLIELGIDSDGLINHKLLTEDAKDVTTLVLDNSIETSEENKITNLKGIEAFINLNALSAGNNALSQINLEENTKLARLHLQANYLKSLDISKNILLEEIDLTLNNLSLIEGLNEAYYLKTLNLTWNYLTALSINLPELIGLNVENNELVELNINGCRSLETIIAKLNKLESIGLSTNSTLKYMTLSANNLSQLNLTQNVALEKLWVSGNALHSLDVSNLNKLNLLSIIQNPNLNCVKIPRDQLIGTVNKQDYQELRTSTCD